jgi:hydroxypyruvate reductase
MPRRLVRAAGGRLVVVAAGKAAGAMMRVALDRIDGSFTGVASIPAGHEPPGPPFPRGVDLVVAGHPTPDAGSLHAAEAALALARTLGPGDELLALISGGGSALLAAPASGLSLADKVATTTALLRSGAAISEINLVRRRLSRIKGGGLAAAAGAAKVTTLIISDIPGDDLSLVASGPTIAPEGAPQTALEIVDRYGLTVPPNVRRILAAPPHRPADRSGAPMKVRRLAGAREALDAAAALARAEGLEVLDLGDDLQGEARALGRRHAALAAERARGPRSRGALILSGGETTVSVRNPRGRGGRNLEYLLGLAIALGGLAGVYALACDTDGIDGAAPAAGAVIGPDTLARAEALGLDPRGRLDANDAFPLFEALGDLVVTGPTRTNVNDFRAILIL